MTKLDKALATALVLVAGVNGSMGLGIYLCNEDSKITDTDVAANLFMCAAAIAGLKGVLHNE